jgi:hypothetical protein
LILHGILDNWNVQAWPAVSARFREAQTSSPFLFPSPASSTCESYHLLVGSNIMKGLLVLVIFDQSMITVTTRDANPVDQVHKSGRNSFVVEFDLLVTKGTIDLSA